MSSFLGAVAPGAVAGVLAANVQVSVSAATAQAVFTAGQRCVVTGFCLRAGATALSATTSFQVGVTTSLAAIVPTTIATSLATTANFYIGRATATTALTVIAAAGVVYFAPVQVDPTATTCFVDVLGYTY